MIRNVRYHVLRDYAGRDIDVDAGDKRRDEAFKSHYVAFTSLLSHPDGLLYCGVTAFDNEILWVFDPEDGTFRSLGYPEVGEPFEVKVHRSLEYAPDGIVYGASACLYALDERRKAPGGALFRYDPDAGKLEKLGVPVRYDYIQTITLDPKRRILYGQTYPVFKFFAYHIDTGKVDDFDYIGSITHISALDDEGCLWGTWDRSRHLLFKYDPSLRDIVYFGHGLPGGEGMANIMYQGAGPVDCMINGEDGYLYIGTTGGTLVRLDPKTAEARHLGKPYPFRRMPGLAMWKDGLLLGVVGDGGSSFLFTYDRETGAFRDLGPVVAEDGLALYRPHDLAIWGDKTIYIAETDVPERSGYLWECEVEL